MALDYLKAFIAKDRYHKHFYPSRLEPGFIRLIQVEQLETPGEDGLSVRCTLNTHRLEDAPPFSTLSYTWARGRLYDHGETMKLGELKKLRTQVIRISGAPMRVTPNLYDVFAIRVVKNGVEGHYWVDAICINQEDDVERAQQVNMMTEIYAKSVQVSIWLGTDDTGEAAVVDELCLKLSAIVHQRYEAGEPILNIKDPSEPGTLEEYGLPSFTDEVWRTLTRFFERLWFWRAWCPQEVAVNGNVNVTCGDIEMHAIALFKASEFLWFSGLSQSLMIYSTASKSQQRRRPRRVGEGPARMALLSSYRDDPEYEGPDGIEMAVTSWTGPPRTETDGARYFCMLVQFLRSLNSADERDKIYACLGIVRAIANTRGFEPPPIEADYSKTVAEVYLEVMTYILEESGMLNYISQAQADPGQVRCKDLPSWVADPSPLGLQNILAQQPQRDTIMGTPFDRSEQRGADFEVRGSVLRVRAILLSVVGQVGNSYPEMADNGLFEETAQMIMRCPRVMPNGQTRVEALWQTTTADRIGPTEESAPYEFVSEFREWIKTCVVVAMFEKGKRFLRKIPSLQRLAESDGGEGIPDFETILRTYNETSRQQLVILRRKCHDRRMYFLWHRRLFRTRDGLLGFGPDSLQSGDTLWTFPGTPLCFGLRLKQNGRYQIFGEAFVHGMDVQTRLTPENGWEWIEIE